jgi:putative ABC transport system substrate-binding protein
MRRRELTALLLAATVSPTLAARAQPSAIPVVGFLAGGSPDSNELLVTAFRQGLAESGYIDGKNVAIEFRWAEGDHKRLPALAADLIRQQVAVIATGNLNAAIAAKGATSTIAIVFVVGDDPIKHGLAAALNHPGGNATGVYVLLADLVAKRLELLRELVPSAASVVLLVNPDNPNVKTQAAETVEAARIVGLQVEIVKATTEEEIATAFALLGSRGAQALLVGADPVFSSLRNHIAALAAGYQVPAIYEFRSFVEAGGLASYGPDLVEADRQLGAYTGKVLAGANPGDLPIMQPTKFELVINMKTAKQLGLMIPPVIFAHADAVIE